VGPAHRAALAALRRRGRRVGVLPGVGRDPQDAAVRDPAWW
jgi:hypothetical protein